MDEGKDPSSPELRVIDEVELIRANAPMFGKGQSTHLDVAAKVGLVPPSADQAKPGTSEGRRRSELKLTGQARAHRGDRVPEGP